MQPTPRLATDTPPAGAPPADTPQAGTPFVTSAYDGRRRVIAAVNAAARALGLRPGLPLAQAQARIPGLAVTEAEPDADAAALGRLAAWCLRYAPLTAPDPPDGVWIDVTGAAHLAGGEATLLADLVDRLRLAGFAARAAIADTPGAAHAVARHGEKIRKVRKTLPLPLRAWAAERRRTLHCHALMLPTQRKPLSCHKAARRPPWRRCQSARCG